MSWEQRNILTLNYPVNNGTIENSDDYEKIVHNAFYNEMREAPEEHPTLLVEGVLTQKEQREKVTQLFFETFNVPVFYLIPKPVLGLIESGNMTGTVLWSGAKGTCVVPVYEGYSIPSCIQKNSFGGDHVTDDLRKILRDRNIRDINPDKLEQLKREIFFVSRDYDQAVQLYSAATQSHKTFYDAKFQFSEDFSVTFGLERFQCSETLFTPNALEKDYNITHSHVPTQDLFANYISGLSSAIPPEFHSAITSTVYVGGGTTCIGGYKNRLKHEVSKIYTKSSMKDITNDERKFMCEPGRELKYMSASQFCRWKPCTEWLTKEVYDDFGPTLIHVLCSH